MRRWELKVKALEEQKISQKLLEKHVFKKKNYLLEDDNEVKEYKSAEILQYFGI